MPLCTLADRARQGGQNRQMGAQRATSQPSHCSPRWVGLSSSPGRALSHVLNRLPWPCTCASTTWTKQRSSLRSSRQIVTAQTAPSTRTTLASSPMSRGESTGRGERSSSSSSAPNMPPATPQRRRPPRQMRTGSQHTPLLPPTRVKGRVMPSRSSANLKEAPQKAQKTRSLHA